MQRLSEFNAHYAIRARQDFDGFKPFLKGFTAAHCRCPVLTERSEGDAAFYLPGDYPFFVDDTNFDNVRAGLSYMKNAFGGPDWRRAIAAIEKLRAASTPDRSAAQFEAMLRTLVG